MIPKDLPVVFNLLKKKLETVKNPYVENLALANGEPFTILIATLLSARTKDAITAQASRNLFREARTPQEMIGLRQDRIAHLIYPVGFYRMKAKNILKLSEKLTAQYASHVPDSIEELVKLNGVGRKTANLVINLAFRKKGICVDTHVHRIVNRWGLITSKNPLETEMKLREVLPREFWVPINRLLVLFGQNVCTPISPWCSKCMIIAYCKRQNVNRSR